LLQNDIQTLHEQLAELLAPLGPNRLRRHVSLAPLTTFRIGGPADLFVEAHSADDLALIIQTARREGLPFFLLGQGANILIGDKGFRGLVIHNKAQHLSVDAERQRLTAESGAIVYPDLIDAAVRCGLSGLEHYAGIPSTVGGALWQNLHFLSPAPERERTMFIEEVLHSAELLLASGERRRVEAEYFEFAYDYSILHRQPDIVLSATFQLTPCEESNMRAIIEANLSWRRERHPPLDTEPSAGSIFKKIEGVGAGRLIDQCGLKGTRIGGIEVTHRHANIMINRGGGTAADVRAMIAYVQEVVKDKTGYLLEPEILFVGEFA
jgi:UDP-N-acetylmuramate dehydrogenase